MAIVANLRPARRRADTCGMGTVDWDAFRLDELSASVRDTQPPADGAKMVWAFEEALRVAQLDEGLLDYLLVATVCLLARATGESPRAVLDAYFRRSVGDDEWQRRYLPLFGSA
jgi:hypothetical protein